MTKIVAIASLFLLTGCAARERIQYVDTSCDWTRPIYISKTDMMTTNTASQILVHNKKWKAFCGGK